MKTILFRIKLWLSTKKNGFRSMNWQIILASAKTPFTIWLAEKDMPALRAGKLWKFKISQVEQWLADGGASRKKSTPKIRTPKWVLRCCLFTILRPQTLIQEARHKAIVSINAVMIELYWNTRIFVWNRLKSVTWYDGVIRNLAEWLAVEELGLTGFHASNIHCMVKFVETYTALNFFMCQQSDGV